MQVTSRTTWMNMKARVKKRSNTGWWNPGEHERFLEGMRLYGRNWKRISLLVGTRTQVQTRTHAQKYFLKLKKNSENRSKSSVLLPMNGSTSPGDIERYNSIDAMIQDICTGQASSPEYENINGRNNKLEKLGNEYYNRYSTASANETNSPHNLKRRRTSIITASTQTQSDFQAIGELFALLQENEAQRNCENKTVRLEQVREAKQVSSAISPRAALKDDVYAEFHSLISQEYQHKFPDPICQVEGVKTTDSSDHMIHPDAMVQYEKTENTSRFPKNSCLRRRNTSNSIPTLL